jgi:hypothetical protein
MIIQEASGLYLPPMARFPLLLLGVLAVRWAGPRLRLPDCVGYIVLVLTAFVGKWVGETS